MSTVAARAHERDNGDNLAASRGRQKSSCHQQRPKFDHVISIHVKDAVQILVA